MELSSGVVGVQGCGGAELYDYGVGGRELLDAAAAE